MSDLHLASGWKIVGAFALTASCAAVVILVFVFVVDGRMHASRVAVQAVIVIAAAGLVGAFGTIYAIVSAVRLLSARFQSLRKRP